MAEARTIYEGKDSDVASAGVVFRNPAGTLALVQRAVSFFTTEYYALATTAQRISCRCRSARI